MNPVLEEALVGAPAMVKLGGKEYPLAFRVHAIILYQRETALLDRQRAEERRKHGVARLQPSEIRELAERRRKVLAEAEPFRPKKEREWPESDQVTWEALQSEANLLKIAIDEDAGTGDSLYDWYDWRKISTEDPERFLLALWVGLHRYDPERPAGRRFVETLSRDELAELVDLSNGAELTAAIGNALSAHIIAKSETPLNETEAEAEIEDPDPNASTPDQAPAEKKMPSPWKARL